MARKSKDIDWYKWVKLLLLPILLIIGIIWYLSSKGGVFFSPIKYTMTPDQVLSHTNNIANDLGTGYEWSFDEYDNEAAKKIAMLNGVNWEAVKKTYKLLFDKNLVDDANRLLDEDSKGKYAKYLTPKGII